MMFGCPMGIWITVGVLLIILLIVVSVKLPKRRRKTLQKAFDLGHDSKV
jgi:dolichyl-phosphate-mannose--protein O-mannosyl transferase